MSLSQIIVETMAYIWVPIAAAIIIFWDIFYSGRGTKKIEGVPADEDKPTSSWGKFLQSGRPLRYMTSLIFLGFALMIGKEMLEAAASKNWPVAKGTIVRAWVSSGSFRGNKEYYPEVNYVYEVGNARFYSDRIELGNDNSCNNQKEAETMLREYPVGASVIVYYDPYNPEKAVLKRGRTPNYGVVVFMLMMAWVMVLPSPEKNENLLS